MNRYKTASMTHARVLITLLWLLLPGYRLHAQKPQPAPDARFVTYVADPSAQHIRLFLKDGQGRNFGSLQRLAAWLKGRNETLLFAMNGGMYREDRMPLGLYIEAGKQIMPVNTGKGDGNFYLSPNGVFYITRRGQAFICATGDYRNNKEVLYATQSGPMLVTGGGIHPKFRKGSANLNIRNGVGILPDKRVVFVMSKKEISLYDFAAYFRQLGCKNALYLDGFVSRTYAPSLQWLQTGGDFGVMIGVLR